MNIKLFQTQGKKLIKSELIDIIIPAGTTRRKFELPNNQNLRNTYLWGIETYSVLEVGFNVLNANSIPITWELMKYITLTLQEYDGDNFTSQKPLIDLRTMSTVIKQSNSFPTMETQPDNWTGQRVNWPKSYIEIAAGAPLNGDEDKAVLLEIYYSEMSKSEIESDKKATFKNQS